MTNANLSFLVCCANGAGSSLMAQLALEKVLKKITLKQQKYTIALYQKEKAVQFNMM